MSRQVAMPEITRTAPPIGDRLLAAIFVALTQIEVWVFTLGDDRDIGVKVAASVLTAIASAALAWRRTRPALSYWVNATAVIGTIAVGYPSDVYQWTNLIATYSIGAYGSSLQRWTALLASVVGPTYYFIRFPFEGGLPLAAFIVSLWIVGWLVGRIYGARLDEMRLRNEMDLSRRLAEANEHRLVLEEERVRIARDLHDIIGHTVNVMVVHAGAGRREIEGDPALVRQAFDTIETTGRSALGELDRVLAVLRGDDETAERLPTPGIADLGALASTLGETGLTVEVEVTGETDSIPASVGVAAYRIVQEALTNTLRHAEADRAVVTVAVNAGSLELSVADDGGGDPVAIHPGRGIVGMSERAAVHGGSVIVERADTGGIEVVARLTWEEEGA